MVRIDNMLTDVILDDLRHETVHRPARSDHEVKDGGATPFFLDRAFKRLHLAENPPHSVQKLGFLFDRMSHPDGHLYTQGDIVYAAMSLVYREIWRVVVEFRSHPTGYGVLLLTDWRPMPLTPGVRLVARAETTYC
jgi:hypothetical protein